MKVQQIGFTLVEVLIVAAIVAILASIGYPAYQNHVSQTRYADGKVKLLEIMNQQRKYFTNNNTYTLNLTSDLNYPDAGSGAVISDGEFYLITAGTCGDPAEPITACVKLTGTANFSGTTEEIKDLTYNSKNIKEGPLKAW